MTFVWTPEIVALATTMWADKCSAEAIAVTLGTTRNAVIGKLNRLNLTRHRTGPRPKKGEPRVQEQAPPTALAAPPQGATVYDASSPPEAEPEPLAALFVAAERPRKAGGLMLTDLRAGQCRWPLGAPMDRPGFFCGAPQVAAKPYCAAHCQIAYTPNVYSRKRAA